jgi:hypothetical protein
VIRTFVFNRIGDSHRYGQNSVRARGCSVQIGGSYRTMLRGASAQGSEEVTKPSLFVTPTRIVSRIPRMNLLEGPSD